MLRERREALGVSLAEAEVATRIRQKYLSALEADEWSLLPGENRGSWFPAQLLRISWHGVDGGHGASPRGRG
ncbi:MAG: helix-turn-helix domain-containing protein [Caldilineaceae bacterium]|nr:helix-turn-helix domain-containing protein [Caldilineaceae bacterium]